MSTSKLGFAVLLLSLGVTLAANTTRSNNICAEKDKPGFQLNLTAALIFPNYILMIDGDLMVYEVPRSLYNNAYGQLTFNISSVYIEEYWPALKTSSDWKRIKPMFKNIYHIIDSKGHIYVYMDVPNALGVCYNVVTKTMCTGLLYKDVDELEQVVSNDQDRVYTIRRDKVDYLPYMFTWYYRYNSEGKVAKGDAKVTGKLYYLVETKNTSNRNITVIMGYRRDYESDAKAIAKNPHYKGWHLEKIEDWHMRQGHLPVGYLYKSYFHLYDLDKVMIFADILPTFNEQHGIKAGTVLCSVSMLVIKLADFFKCSAPLDANQSIPTYPPVQVPQWTPVEPSMLHSNLALIIGIAVAVLLLLLVLACGYYFLCLKKKKKKKRRQDGGTHKHPRSHKTVHSQNGSKQSVVPGASRKVSMRSKGLSAEKVSRGRVTSKRTIAV